jgi:uncharacterized protein YabE (DUF348 family)
MDLMSRLLKVALVAALLAACSGAPATPRQTLPARTITVIDAGEITSVAPGAGSAAEVLGTAGITLGPDDRVWADGINVAPDQALPSGTTAIQVRRAVALALVENGKDRTIQTSAPTVGQALVEAGIELHAADLLDPPAATPILGPLTVTLTPSQLLTVKTEGGELSTRSVAKSVGAALAAGGIGLQGADYSLPDESSPLPMDGQVRIVRVNETMLLTQKPIPYSTEYRLTDKLELDQQDLLQVGQPGLTVSRVRVRYEDGKETARTTEAETTVRPPQDRIIGTGTKVVIHTLDTPSGPLKYWRAVKVYATSYSPCRSGDRCYTGTAGGLPVRRGVIGVVRRWWYSMNGQPVYVPGYGKAVISDIGAGIPGTPWIDLGFSDGDYESWHQWVTIYFLTPVPPSILYDLQ